MYYGKHPWGKYALWIIAMIVGALILIYVGIYLSFWLMAMGWYNFQGNLILQLVLSWGFFFTIPIWEIFCMFRMVKAYRNANPQLAAAQRGFYAPGANFKYCLNCGASMPSVSTYCPNCGAQQIPPPP